MKGSIVLFAVLAGALAASAAFPDPSTYCGEPGIPGGWTKIDETDAQVVDALTPYMDLAVEEFLANNGTIACPDTYQTTLDIGCSQVVAGTNYKLFFAVECAEDDTVVPTVLEAEVFVPLPNSGEMVEVTNVSEFTDF